VARATYDPAALAVTLTLSQKRSTTLRYRLTVVGKAPSSLRNGRPGNNSKAAVPAASIMAAGLDNLS
jgi:hypothetical protein